MGWKPNEIKEKKIKSKPTYFYYHKKFDQILIARYKII